MNNIIKKYKIKEVNNLYVMDNSDISKFAESAMLAYKEYPLFKYLTKNKFKDNVVKNIIAASLSSMKGQVLGLSTEEDANAIAIFGPPNYQGSKALPFLMGGGSKLFFISPLSIFLRLLNYEKHAMALKKKYTNHNCWYLYNVQ